MGISHLCMQILSVSDFEAGEVVDADKVVAY